jgi:hypothetical protein
VVTGKIPIASIGSFVVPTTVGLVLTGYAPTPSLIIRALYLFRTLRSSRAVSKVRTLWPTRTTKSSHPDRDVEVNG